MVTFYNKVVMIVFSFGFIFAVFCSCLPVFNLLVCLHGPELHGQVGDVK